MEEVDKIVIHSLKDIGCCIDDGVISLGEMKREDVTEAAVRCLTVIQPDLCLSLRAPSHNVAARFQHSAAIAQACKDLGYKGEMGYQTLLYSDTTELRKVLMFLIDRLPREQHDSSQPTTTSGDALSQAKLLIASSLSNQVRDRWRGEEDLVDSLPFVSLPLETGIIPRSNMNPQEWREYCREQLMWFTDCLPPNLLYSSVCSLLDTDRRSEVKEFNGERLPLAKCRSKARTPTPRQRSAASWLSLHQPPSTPPQPKPRQRRDVIVSDESNNDALSETSSAVTEESAEDDEARLAADLDECNQRVTENMSDLQLLEDKLSQLRDELKEVSGGSDSLTKVEARRRAVELLAERDESIVDEARCKLADKKERIKSLQRQWKERSEPLAQVIALTSDRISGIKKEEGELRDKVREVERRVMEARRETEVKEESMSRLEVQLAAAPKHIHRSMYTRRIVEIIGSIDKQKMEIERILKDTRQVQKDMTSVSGKLDRSYTVVDELIFKNAKRDEVSRRAYKLLATLHSDCSDIISYVRETGALVREISDITEQIKTESSRMAGASLSRITSDLEQMRHETRALRAELEAATS